MENCTEISAAVIIGFLRRNGKAKGIRNSGFGGLGQQCYSMICTEFGGQLIRENVPSIWAKLGYPNLGNYALPTKSAVYLLPKKQMPLLMDRLARY
jgi:hypothetical protein